MIDSNTSHPLPLNPPSPLYFRIKGQGANQALLDAVLLARTIFSAYNTTIDIEKGKPQHRFFDDNEQDPMKSDIISIALREFEEKMMERAKPKVMQSAEAARFLHSDAMLVEGDFTRGEAARLQLVKEEKKRGRGLSDEDVANDGRAKQAAST